MKKIILILIILLFIPKNLNALNIDKSLIYDLDNDKVIYENNINEEIKSTSLNKLMIALNIVENIKILDYNVIVTKEMLENLNKNSIKAGFKVDDYVKYPDLLCAMIMLNADDAAHILTLNFMGIMDSEVIYMNETAKKLELSNTTFLSVNESKTRVNDIFKFMKYSLNNERFNNIFSTKEKIAKNKMVFKSKYIDKDYVIGSITNDKEIIATLDINGSNILVITSNYTDLESIYEYLNNNYNLIYKKNDVIYSIKTKYAKEEVYEVKLKKKLFTYINDFNKDKVKVVYEGNKEIKYNTKLNTKLGNIKIYYEDELLKEEEVFLESELHFSMLKYIRSKIIYLVLIALIVLAIVYRRRKNEVH